MQQAILESLPIAIGIALSSLPLVAIPLILITRREPAVLAGFIGGWVLGFLVVGSITFFAADLLTPNDAGPPLWVLRLRVVLGLVLLLLAWTKWRSRAKPGADVELPGWMSAVNTMSAPRALFLGCLLIVVNPKNVVLVSSGALAIASETYVRSLQFSALFAFIIISSLGMIAPLFATLAFGPRAFAPLEKMKSFLARNSKAIMATVLGVLGLVVVMNALAELV
jgi:hypothetical protein